jgi:hypothetical protein
MPAASIAVRADGNDFRETAGLRIRVAPETNRVAAPYRRAVRPPSFESMAKTKTSESFVVDLELLVIEIDRYLEIVEELREGGREPRWRAEDPS